MFHLSLFLASLLTISSGNEIDPRPKPIATKIASQSYQQVKNSLPDPKTCCASHTVYYQCPGYGDRFFEKSAAMCVTYTDYSVACSTASNGAAEQANKKPNECPPPPSGPPSSPPKKSPTY